MAIDYDSLRTFDAWPSGSVAEHYFRVEELGADDGFGVLLKYSAFVSQIVANWANSVAMVLSVQLPSGIEYTLTTTASTTSFVLNHRDTGSNNFIYWTKLPANSKIRFGSASALGDMSVSIVAKPV